MRPLANTARRRSVTANGRADMSSGSQRASNCHAASGRPASVSRDWATLDRSAGRATPTAHPLRHIAVRVGGRLDLWPPPAVALFTPVVDVTSLRHRQRHYTRDYYTTTYVVIDKYCRYLSERPLQYTCLVSFMCVISAAYVLYYWLQQYDIAL